MTWWVSVIKVSFSESRGLKNVDHQNMVIVIELVIFYVVRWKIIHHQQVRVETLKLYTDRQVRSGQLQKK